MNHCAWTSVDGWGCNYTAGHVGWHERHLTPAQVRQRLGLCHSTDPRHDCAGEMVAGILAAIGPNEGALIAERAQPGDTCTHAVNSDCPHYS